MLKNELLEIITNCENSEVEFKRDDLRPEQIAKEIVGFANMYGVRVFLRIEPISRFAGMMTVSKLSVRELYQIL